MKDRKCHVKMNVEFCKETGVMLSYDKEPALIMYIGQVDKNVGKDFARTIGVVVRLMRTGEVMTVDPTVIMFEETDWKVAREVVKDVMKEIRDAGSCSPTRDIGDAGNSN